MSNIENFTGDTKADIEPNKVLDAAKKAKLQTVMVLGFTDDESLYFASSTGDIATALLLLEYSKKELLDFE